MIDKIKKIIQFQWTIVVSAILVILIGIASVIIYNEWQARRNHKDIVLEDTPVSIESIMPKGDLYVCSAIIEDYECVQKTERHIGIIPEKHSCVQIIRQKCSYKIDLKKVRYTHGENKTIYVRLPKLDYVASTQDTPFISDDEEFWAKEIPNTNKLKKKVEQKIRSRFESKENKNKATRYAEDAIAELLKKFGYEAEFISTLEKKKE